MERHPKANRHHVWFEKRDYRKRSEREFRNYKGFVIPDTQIDVHNYLHAEVEPPEKPYRDEMLGILALCADRDEYDHSDNPFWAMESAMAYYVGREVDSPNDAEHCRAIRFNLAQQIGILANEHTFDDPVTRTESLLLAKPL